MFNCGKCGETSAHGVQATKVVVETRAATYPRRAKVYDNEERPDDPGGNGTAIVKEISICEDCAGIVKPVIAT